MASPALEICSQNVMRPTWESDFKSKVTFVLCIAFALVLCASAMDSDRILKEHLKQLARERGPMQAPLDLRKIGLEARDIKNMCFSPSPQERLNNLNNHQTSFNNIRKRLTLTKTLTALKNKITGTKVESSTKNSSPKPSTKNEMNINNSNKTKNNENSKKSVEEDSASSSSSKENCEIVTMKKNEIQNSIKNSKKSKNQLNLNEAKNCSVQQQQQKAIVKPLNNNQNQNRVKNKLTAAVSPTLNVKLSSDENSVKSHSPTSNASFNEGHPSNNHVNFMNDLIADTNDAIDVNNAIKVKIIDFKGWELFLRDPKDLSKLSFTLSPCIFDPHSCNIFT